MIEESSVRYESSRFNDYIDDILPMIDEALAQQGEALTQRPHKAACFIVEHCIEGIVGDTKDGYFVKAWFGALLSAVLEWYERVYGDAMHSGPKKTHTSVLLVRSTPTALEVPLRLMSPLGTDGSRWLTFASDILPGEDPLSWLVRPPKLCFLDEDELIAIAAEAAQISVNLRRASNGVLTIKKDHRESTQHGILVLQYLQRAAQGILINEGPALSTAVWDANFASEQAIKCNLKQSLSIRIPNVHDVRNLAKLAVETPSPIEIIEALEAMPSGTVAVQHRYGELPAPALPLVLSYYRASIAICCHFLNAHPRNIGFNNASFQLKFPPMSEKVGCAKD